MELAASLRIRFWRPGAAGHDLLGDGPGQDGSQPNVGDEVIPRSAGQRSATRHITATALRTAACQYRAANSTSSHGPSAPISRSTTVRVVDHTARPKFSLLHATYRCGSRAVEIRDAWISRAFRPECVEHIFSFDIDDTVSMSFPAISENGLCNPSLGGLVSAVQNWNVAAEKARGDILVVIADDLEPPANWDTEILRAIKGLDPNRCGFVLKVRDSDDARDTTIRHPVVSWYYFSKYGLWDPSYRGHGVDNHFTLEAHRRGRVIDGRSLQLLHHQPAAGEAGTESQEKMRSFGSYDFLDRTPRWQRFLRCTYVSVPHHELELRRSRVLIAATAARSGYLWGALPDGVQSSIRRRTRRLRHS